MAKLFYGEKLRAMTVVTSGRVEARTDWEQAQGSF